jgi:hypothetical protein
VPKIKDELYRAHNQGIHSHLKLSIVFDLKTKQFTTKVPALYACAAPADQIDYAKTRVHGGDDFYLKHDTLAGLEERIHTMLHRFACPVITEKPVIRFNIVSHITFAVTDEGQVAPNSGYPGAKWETDAIKRRMYGDHYAASPTPGGYSLIMGAQAMLRREIKHGDITRVEYGRWNGPRADHRGSKHPAALLNGWCGFHLEASGFHPREIPYTDEAAEWFSRMLYGMATLSRLVQEQTFDNDRLLAAISAGPLLEN